MAVLVKTRWFNETLIYAAAIMSEQVNLNSDMINGAKMFRSLLMNLGADVESKLPTMTSGINTRFDEPKTQTPKD